MSSTIKTVFPKLHKLKFVEAIRSSQALACNDSDTQLPEPCKSLLLFCSWLSCACAHRFDAGGRVEGFESPGYGARTPTPRRSTNPPAELFSFRSRRKALILEKGTINLQDGGSVVPYLQYFRRKGTMIGCTCPTVVSSFCCKVGSGTKNAKKGTTNKAKAIFVVPFLEISGQLAFRHHGRRRKGAERPFLPVVCHVLQGCGAVTGWEPRERGARVRP